MSQLIIALVFSGISYAESRNPKSSFNKTLSVLKEKDNKVKQAKKLAIRGTVTDEKGDPLVGVTVKVQGTTIGATTDKDGKFTINAANENDILIFTYIGYVSKTENIGNRTVINVILKSDTEALSEIVVVGYGSQKKASLTGAVSTIKGKEITEAPVVNVSNTLAGRLPGLTAVTSSSEPGADGSTLRIRGSNTFNDNGVLVVIDGVPDRSLDRLDPNSIESVTMLKDASAAIYGSRAANGVILITTKRGKTGKPEITFNTNYGFSEPTRLPKMADAATYATLLNEIAYYDNNAVGLNSKYTAAEIQKYRDGSDPLRYPNTDWFKEVIKPRSAQDNQNITVSGGSDATRYFVSLGRKFQDGNYYNSATSFKQYDFRSNIDGKINQYINIGVDFSGRMEDRKYPIRGANDIFRGLVQSYPNSVAKWPGGEPGPAIEGGRNALVTSTDAAGNVTDKYYALNSNLKLDIKIPGVKGLSINGNLSYDQGFDFKKSFSTPFKLYTWDRTTVDANGNPVLASNTYGGGTNNMPALSQSFVSNYSKLAYGVINYETTIAEKHYLKLMAGSQISKVRNDNFSASRDQYLSSSVQQLFAGDLRNMTNTGSASAESRVSYFGRANYNFANKYLVEFIGRYDGSYIFAPGRRYGFFPGVSAGWVASDESFWKDNIKFIDYFKLRASWGKTGNDRTDPYQYLSSYTIGSQVASYYPFIVNNTSELGTIYGGGFYNTDITWETANQTNIGFNASFLDSRLTIEADYFSYKRDNILWPQMGLVPSTVGASLPAINYAKAANRGFDFSAAFTDNKHKFGYSVAVNGGYAKNKIIDWAETPGVLDWQKTTGFPMGSGLYYKTDGIYHSASEIPANLNYEIGTPKPGDVKFVDHNGDGKINADDQVRIYKNNIPTFTFGANINLNYKNFDLSALIQGATGAVAYITSEAGQFGNYYQSFADARWTPDNPGATGPRTFNRGNLYWANQSNDYWLRKTDYVRLKTLQFGYTLNTSTIQKAGIQKLRVYVSGYNLFTYSPDMKDFDPEIGSNTNARGSAASITGYNYPLTKVMSVGLSASL
ncbi:SusC/RagA family TonB-linked outer membrane protein [Pedobacter sp. N23S346]|uniref:SusC/RagA family TonB-linked outer membrane protein n=1 Tax=Pedobacter sp. N23S346 TaxID=3402750 RepID=UPI003AC5786A